MTIQPAFTLPTGRLLNTPVAAICRTSSQGKLERQRVLAPLLLVLLFGYAGNATAQAINPPMKFTVPYCTEASFPSQCRKTITIYNNSDHPIYPVLQGTLEQGPGVNGCKPGDRWLQAAFGDTNNCYAQVYNYLVYVNGINGIAKDKHATIIVPWWSKRVPDSQNPDLYIDWWNGARIYIFDDQEAVNDSYATDHLRPVKYMPGEIHKVHCAEDDSESVCDKTLTIAYQTCAAAPDGSNPCIPGTTAINAETPQQLNEYTLASVDPVEGLTNWNVNYNVSNVDQVYLPIAIEPMVKATGNNETNTIGYLGTTLKVKEVRDRLMLFTGATGSVHDPENPTMWPIYTIQKDKNTDKPLYPMAGIRVPGAANVFNFLAQPSGKTLTPSPNCVAPGCIPTTSNKNWTGTALVDGMIAQWMACTGASPPKTCRIEEGPLYTDVNGEFKTNYGLYFNKCGPSFPSWLAPVSGTGLPNLYAFLQFVYGWVPFNVACGGIDLPVGMVPREYIMLQDNFQEVRGLSPAEGQQIFNPYAQLVHAAPNGTPPVPYGLDAATYAYSIDDQSSFLSQPGVGLIFAVGGKEGLPNPHKHIFPPPLDPEHDIQVILGPPDPQDRPAWQAYALCPKDPNAIPTTTFPNPPTDPDGGQRFSVPTDNPKIWRKPCYLTISDAANKVYQIEVTKKLPWPAFNNVTNNGGFDHMVMTCPTPNITGYTSVPANPNDPNTWCGAINEVSNPIGMPMNAQRFELDTRPPNQ